MWRLTRVARAWGGTPVWQARRLPHYGVLPAPAQNPDGSPGRHNEGNGEGPEHGGARADGDGPHVRPHQAADEGHRQHRGDDGEGGEDGRVADFIDGLNRDG